MMARVRCVCGGPSNYGEASRIRFQKGKKPRQGTGWKAKAIKCQFTYTVDRVTTQIKYCKSNENTP